MVDGMMRQSDYKNVVWNQNPMETFFRQRSKFDPENHVINSVLEDVVKS